MDQLIEARRSLRHYRLAFQTLCALFWVAGIVLAVLILKDQPDHVNEILWLYLIEGGFTLLVIVFGFLLIIKEIPQPCLIQVAVLGWFFLIPLVLTLSSLGNDLPFLLFYYPIFTLVLSFLDMIVVGIYA